MVRELTISFLVAFMTAIVAISVFYYGFMHKPQLETAKIFSTLYERCQGYVEKSESFDASNLAPGGLRPSTKNTANSLEDQYIWHHPQELIVVKATERSNQNRIRRQCNISLSANGKRPPISSIGLVMMEFFSIKRNLLAEGNHVEYTYPYQVQDTFAFRSKGVDKFGCAVIHSFSLDNIGENFHMKLFQEGIACEI